MARHFLRLDERNPACGEGYADAAFRWEGPGFFVQQVPDRRTELGARLPETIAIVKKSHTLPSGFTLR